jgi:hypothetical protein
MPQPRSARFDQAQRAPHNPIVRVDLLDGGNTVIQRDVPVLPDGDLTVDRTAANALVRTLNVPLDALSPDALDLLRNNLADAYLQTYRGIRYEDTQILGKVHNSLESWTPVNGGVMVGVTVDGSGWLQLGP